MNYVMVTSLDAKEFIESCNKLLAHGAVPQGGVATVLVQVELGRTCVQFAQAFIK